MATSRVGGHGKGEQATDANAALAILFAAIHAWICEKWLSFEKVLSLLQISKNLVEILRVF